MIERIVSSIIDSNVFVVSNENACVVIDAGVCLEDLKKIVDGKNVEGIFLTHGHYDHCFFVEQYIKEFGCKVFCSENIKDYLQSPEHNYSEGKFVVTNFSDFVFLNEFGTLTLPSFNITFKQLGGHSKSDMCFQIGEEIFVGDVLIGRDMGRIDLYGGDKTSMAESLRYLLNADYGVMHSGHGEDNSKISQNKVANLWLRFLSRQEK